MQKLKNYKKNVSVGVLLSDLKEANFNRPDAPVYKPLRRISVYLSYLLIKIGVSPHFVTGMCLLITGLASSLLIKGTLESCRIAGVLLIIAYILDCVDGEVARGSGRTSILGTQFEHIAHWFTIGILQAAAAVGSFNTTHNTQPLMWGYVACIGWYGFYYFYMQLRTWIPRDEPVKMLRIWSKIIFYSMPMDENLLIIFSIVGKIHYYVLISAFMSVILFLLTLLLFLYYQRELNAAYNRSTSVSSDKTDPI